MSNIDDKLNEVLNIAEEVLDKKEDKKLTGEQAVKKIQTLKKDLFNIRFKKINGLQIGWNQLRQKLAPDQVRNHEGRKGYLHSENQKFSF